MAKLTPPMMPSGSVEHGKPNGRAVSLLISTLDRWFARVAERVNVDLPESTDVMLLDGTQAMTAPIGLDTYLSAARPTPAAGNAGHLIYVSDGGAGAVFQGSNGSAWVNLG